jgi:hypothetical protein
LDNDIPEVSSQVDHGSDIDSDFDSDGRWRGNDSEDSMALTQSGIPWLHNLHQQAVSTVDKVV